MQQMKVSFGGDAKDFPLGMSLLLFGSVGSGKTTFCLNLTKEFLSNKKPVVWVCLDSSPQSVRDQLNYFKVKVQEYETRGLLHYVDGYTSQVSGTPPKDPSIVYCSSPVNLNELTLALKKVFDKISDKGIVVLDSISTLLLYTNRSVCEEFLKVHMNRVTSQGFTGFYILQKDLHDKSVEETVK
ncbi:MAG: hypothetical protein GF334_06795, partial [Candidatus Altiarchaeales archaeon]|nr:hypothetical protein [Candidatus Altiarchaeales archaeon]